MSAEEKSEVYPSTLNEAIDLYYYSYGNGRGGFDNLSLSKFKDIVETFVNDYGNPAWSEEDESMRIRCIGILSKCYMGELPTEVEEELNWLKDRLGSY